MIRIRARFLAAVLAAAPFAFAQRAPIEQQLTFTPCHAGGIYDVGETVGWTVAPGPVTPTYDYKWTARRNNAVVLKEGKLDLSSGRDKIEISGDQPEMIYVAIEPYARLASDAPAPPSRRRRSDSRRRAPTISTHSGTANWPHRPRSRSTLSSPR